MPTLCECVATCIDPAIDNIIEVGPNGGLYAQEAQIVGRHGIEVTSVGDTGSPFTIDVDLSSDVDNLLDFDLTDKLRARFNAAESSTIGFTGNGTAGQAFTPVVKIDPNANNKLVVGSGLLVDTGNLSAGNGIVVTGNGRAATPHVVTARLSSDAGNDLSFGTDNGLYIDASASGGGGSPTTINNAAGITVTGVGTVGNPYIIGAKRSIDADNHLVFGTDSGLYVNVQDEINHAYAIVQRSDATVGVAAANIGNNYVNFTHMDYSSDGSVVWGGGAPDRIYFMPGHTLYWIKVYLEILRKDTYTDPAKSYQMFNAGVAIFNSSDQAVAYVGGKQSNLDVGKHSLTWSSPISQTYIASDPLGTGAPNMAYMKVFVDNFDTDEFDAGDPSPNPNTVEYLRCSVVMIGNGY